MHRLRIQASGRRQVLHFRDGDAGGHRHHMVKIAGRLAVAEVPFRIARMGMNNGEIGFERVFEYAGFAVDHARLPLSCDSLQYW